MTKRLELHYAKQAKAGNRKQIMAEIQQARVGEDAVQRMQKLLQAIAERVVDESIIFMKHAERKTLKGPDVDVAVRVLRLDQLEKEAEMFWDSLLKTKPSEEEV